MSRLMPWFPLYAPNWLAEAQLLSIEARAARIGILALVWHHGERGELALTGDVWAALIGIPADRFHRLLDELRARQHVEVLADSFGLRLRCPELFDHSQRREAQACEKRSQRLRGSTRREGPRSQVSADVPAVSEPTSGSCPPQVEEEAQVQVEGQGSGDGSVQTDAPPSVACLGPRASASVSASAPSSTAIACSPASQIAPPSDLRPFARWWQLEAVSERERAAQARFVESWESLLADLDRAYPVLDIEVELAKAYAWETANPSRRKTPRGRASFLRGWIERAQNKPAGLR